MTTEGESKSLFAHDIPLVFPPITRGLKPDQIKSFDEYKAQQKASCENREEFWAAQAKERLDWFVPFNEKNICHGDFLNGDVSWFNDGKLNVSYNAIDRHVNAGKGDQIAMIHEGDEPDQIRKITYLELQRKVCQIANALVACTALNRKDVVTIYMPMIPELAMTMLACARIGIMHSVVFAGFSSEALAQRISAAASKVLVTADIGKRGGKTIPLKEIVDDARTKADCEQYISKVLVWERFYDPEKPVTYEMKPKDLRMDELVKLQRPYCSPQWMDAEDPLFLLYTSGSTGKPKGLLHTTGGYALYAAFTTANTFALQEGDIFACVADCGWITGHTYVVYGPLLNGSTTFLFESTPVYPDAGRYWDMVQRHRITQFYTAPTAIRLLMRYGDDPVTKYDLSSLKVLGTVGEPINPEAWRWYYEVVGRKQCTVADTYWQTETGGHVITNFPGVTPMKPGSCTIPSYGIEVVVLDSVTGKPVVEADEKGHFVGVLAIKHPWPGMARTCFGDHQRYLNTYTRPYPGYYFTGDSAMIDADGYTWVIGRVDDVINVSGHRIGTAEVESALDAHPLVAQAAVVGQPHEIKGQSIAAFCMLVEGAEESDNLLKELKQLVRQEIGGFAMPDMICIAPTLPMTRSGKIMRRILRKIVTKETENLGDTSTLSDPSIVQTLIDKVCLLQESK